VKAQKKLKEFKAAVREATKKFDDNQSEIDTRKQQLSESRLKDLEAQLSTLQQTTIALNDKLDEDKALERRISETLRVNTTQQQTAALATLNGKLTQKQKDLVEATCQITTLSVGVERALKVAEVISRTRDQLEQDRRAAESFKEGLERELAAARRANPYSQAEVDRLTAKIASQVTTIQGFVSNIATVSLTHRDAQALYDAEVTKKMDVEKRKETIMQDVNELREVTNREQAKLDANVSNGQQQQFALAEVKDRLHMNQNKSQNLENQVGILSKTVDAERKGVQTLQMELATFERQGKALLREKDEAASDYQDARENANAATRANEDAETAFANAQRAMDDSKKRTTIAVTNWRRPTGL
jgi:chromosome segregation ATPase